jgi:BirA family biotin operon repressor/biotin-[acetyl-CoA-carboxylase] ligase
MTILDVETIRRQMSRAALGQLASLDVFAEIESTNSYLMHKPGPVAGQMAVAVTDHQTAGRGRFGKTWHSPRGAGLCLSAAYTFARLPENLPALTLAIGLAAIRALDSVGASGVQLKWPNDLVAADGKLGGILTEVQPSSNKTVTVVTGIGINIDHGDALAPLAPDGWATRAVDLKSFCKCPVSHEELASALLSELHETFAQYAASGFAPHARDWAQHDWLLNKEIKLQVGSEEVVGVASGIAADGALRVETANSGLLAVTSGSILAVGPRCNTA